MNTFSGILLWLSGSSRKAANTVSPAAVNVNERIGLLVLLCIFVAFFGGMAVGKRFIGDSLAVMLICGLAWAVVVAVVDQAVLASMDAVSKDGKLYKALLLMRIGIAALLGTIPAQELVYTAYAPRVAYEAKQIEIEVKEQAREKVAELHDLPATEKLVAASTKRVEELNAMARTLPPDIRKKLVASNRCDDELTILRQKHATLLADINAKASIVDGYSSRIQSKATKCNSLRKEAWGAKKAYDDRIQGELATAKDQKHEVEVRHHEASATAAKELADHAALAEAGLSSGGGRSLAMKRIMETDTEAATMVWVIRAIILVLETLPFILKGTISNPLSEKVRHDILTEAASFKLATALAHRFDEESLKVARNSPEIADLARSAVLDAAERQARVLEPLRDFHTACEAIIAQQEAIEALMRRAPGDTGAQIAEAYLAAVREAYRRLAEMSMRRAPEASPA